MIVHMDNSESVKLFGAHHGFMVFTGAHYLGGYIGDDESKFDYLKKRTEK